MCSRRRTVSRPVKSKGAKFVSCDKGKTIHYVLVVVSACACYYNALEGDFVFDDVSAVGDNKDIRPRTPLFSLLWNDFWGTPIHKEHSHKSYRPLCVFTFRLNYLMHELRPWGYHLVNIALHCVCCVLYLKVSALFLPDPSTYVAALLFAVHPVHTEAVASIVGRAETLSSTFFLLAFLAYNKSLDRTTDWFYMVVCILMVVMATLSKEQGITSLGVCCVYELFIVQKLRLHELVSVARNLVSRRPSPVWQREMVYRLVALFTAAICLLTVRIKLMGSRLPVFSKFDNPAAAANWPSRQLTYNYVVAVNAWLLLCPCDLCCDWTMGSIPLVESHLDLRNTATAVFYITMIVLVWKAFTLEDHSSEVLFMGLSLMVFPFLPASNLFFPVGFVVAERVLYMPSFGFCLIVAYGWQKVLERSGNKLVLWSALLLLVCVHAFKTTFRNYDWKSDYTIFMAGLKVNPRNVKLYNNVGHFLENEGRFKEALEYYTVATRIQPDDVGAHMNIARIYTHFKMFAEAEDALKKAKDLLPRPRSGENYRTRIAPSHLKVFLNLANLISRNGTRLQEADNLYKQAISMREDYIQAYINRGDILIKLNRTMEAQAVFQKALLYDNSNADIHHNLGVVYLEMGKFSLALGYFIRALDLNPHHEQALLNLAILAQEGGTLHTRKLAFGRLSSYVQSRGSNERVYFNLGMLAIGENNILLAEAMFKKAIEIKDDFKLAIFNLGLLLKESNRPLEAMPFLQRLLKFYPKHIKGLFLLGDIYYNHMNNSGAAEKCYERIVREESSNIQAHHNLCVIYAGRKQWGRAEECLLQLISLAPNEEYIQRHLKIVRLRAQEQKTEFGKATNLVHPPVKTRTLPNDQCQSSTVSFPQLNSLEDL